MVRNRRLARAISDCGWGEFRRQLEYKCERARHELVVIDRWYPSSKTCSACGYLLARLSLSTRHWTCPGCRARHDRDINAAKNILAAGLAVARGSPGDACGADVRHSGSSRVRSAVKQEPWPVTAGISVFRAGSSQELICTLLWSPSTRRCALGTLGAGVTSTWCPMREASMRRTPRIDAPARTMEYSISLSAITQPGAIEVNGPM